MTRLFRLKPLPASGRVKRYGLEPGREYDLGEPDPAGLCDVRRPGVDTVITRAPIEAFEPVLRRVE